MMVRLPLAMIRYLIIVHLFHCIIYYIIIHILLAILIGMRYDEYKYYAHTLSKNIDSDHAGDWRKRVVQYQSNRVEILFV